MSRALRDPRERMLESDLRALERLVVSYGRPPSEGAIRLATVILRRWLLDGLLGQLCNASSAKATFPIADNRPIIHALAKGANVEYYLTAAVRFDGHPLLHFFHSKLDAEMGPVLPFDDYGHRLVGTKEFLKQKRLFFRGSMFSCEEIIQFTANKAGGVHLDGKLNPRQALLLAASTYMTFGGPRENLDQDPPGEIYLPLEPNGSEVLSGLHIEIIAAAASLLGVHINGQPLMTRTD